MTSAAGYTFAPVTSHIINVTFTQNLNLSNGNTLSPEEQSQIERYKATLEAIKHSYMWIIFAFGFPGNLLSLFVILRLRCFGSPALYVATLAVVDNLAIVVKLLLVQFGDHKVAIGLLGCKIMFFLGNHLVVYANWVLVTMAIERFIAVWQPLHVSRMWTSRKAAISLGMVLLVTVALTAPLFVTVTVADKGGVQKCIVDRKYMELMGVWQWTQVTAYGFLPCTLLLTLNILIIVVISRARRFHQSMTSSSSSSVKGNVSKNQSPNTPGGVQRQATIMLVVTSAVLVLTTTPICVYILVQQWWHPERGTVEFAKKELIRFVLRAVCDANHSVNFYLYFVSARKFRNYFCKVVCWLCFRYDDKRSSEAPTRHLSAFRSTFKVKERSEGYHLVFQRKQLPENDGSAEKNVKMEMYTEKKMNGMDGSPCSSPL